MIAVFCLWTFRPNSNQFVDFFQANSSSIESGSQLPAVALEFMDKVAAAASGQSDPPTVSSNDVQKSVTQDKNVASVVVEAVTKAVEKLDINKAEVKSGTGGATSAVSAQSTDKSSGGKSSPVPAAASLHVQKEVAETAVPVTNGGTTTISSSVTPIKTLHASPTSSPLPAKTAVDKGLQNGDLDMSPPSLPVVDKGELQLMIV